MAQAIWVLVNCNSAKEAEKIGRKILKKRYCSCFDIVPRYLAIYFWPPRTRASTVRGRPKNGRLEKSKGATLILETFKEKYNLIKKEVKKLHSDKMPFIGFVEIKGLDKEYIEWVRGEIDDGSRWSFPPAEFAFISTFVPLRGTRYLTDILGWVKLKTGEITIIVWPKRKRKRKGAVLADRRRVKDWDCWKSGNLFLVFYIQFFENLIRVRLKISFLELPRQILFAPQWSKTSAAGVILRVWSWLRMNAGGVDKACKSNGCSNTAVANGLVTRGLRTPKTGITPRNRG